MTKDDDSSTGKKGTGKKKAEYERIRQSGRERLTQLAQPKVPRIEKWTSVGPHLMWGTQETLWPIKSSTLNAEPTERLIALATPKKNFQEGKENRPLFYYSCGRTSVICNVGKGAKSAEATERLTLLAQAKDPHKNFQPDSLNRLPPMPWDNTPLFEYSCGRDTPIWTVSRGAKSCGEKPRTSSLARHKTPHPQYFGEKPIQSIVSEYALKAEPTERIQGLARPKSRAEGPFREPLWPVSNSAKNATATHRSVELARPKQPVEGYQLPKEVEWPVSRAAKRASATGRINELSVPIVRASMDHVQFNPDAFIVKPLALKGSFPSRIQDLARPIER